MSATSRPGIDSFASPSEVRDRVGQLRVRLLWVRVGRVLLSSMAVGLLTLLVLRVALRVLPSGASAERVATSVVSGFPTHALPYVLAAIAAGLVWWWHAARWEAITAVRAALWYEEHHPANHAVVTLVEAARERLAPEVERRLAAAAALPASPGLPAGDALQRAMWHTWRTPLAMVAALTAALLLVARVPEGTVARLLTAAQSVPGGNVAGSPAALGAWSIEVVPPAYSGLPARTLGDSSTVEALAGSRIWLFGRGRAQELSAMLTIRSDSVRASSYLTVDAASDGWQLRTAMPSHPAVVRLASSSDSRLLVLVPRADSLPQVRLTAPLRDSVYRDTTGSITLTAEVRDDLGLASAVFELILTSGSGERYSAKTIALGARRFQSERSGVLTYRLSFDQLGVAPGDVMHLRAVARDAHPAAAREAGVSETRSLRFARAEEYDSVAVEAAPPPAVDSSLLSQRMLLDLTEKLEARRPRIARELLVSEARKLALEQARIRRAVSAVVYQRLSGDGQSEHVHYEGDGHDHGITLQDGKLVPSFGGSGQNVMPGATVPGAPVRANDNATDESPIIAVNRPLLEAYNAMWDAGRALELGDTRAAIAPMRLALAAIQRARAAERVYLRGRVRAVVVDLARVRLVGRDTGSSARRVPGEAVPDPVRIADARLLRAAEELQVDPVAGRDSLMVLRLDAITAAPAFARALEVVLVALAKGGDATDALVRARRTLTQPRAAGGVSAWSVP